jgi:uncharacterized protein (TIGR02284 family)
LGGEPHEGCSVTGALQRRWDVKSRISSMDESAILDEVERGREAGYEKALRSSLPHDVRSMLERHYRSGRDRVRELRDAAGQSISTATQYRGT